MTENGREPGADVLQQILDPVKARVEELHVQRERYSVALGEVDLELRRLNKVLHAAGLLEPVASKKAPAKSTLKVSEANIAAVYQVLKERGGDEAFTYAEVAEWAGVSYDMGRMVVKELRDRELVRSVGRLPAPEGRRGLMPAAYRLMSDGTAE
jgi:hypothetical protein